MITGHLVFVQLWLFQSVSWVPVYTVVYKKVDFYFYNFGRILWVKFIFAVAFVDELQKNLE